MPTSYNLIAGKGLDRLAALSDGLFAIAMTLIVLEIRVPERALISDERSLGTALVALLPRVVTYLLSFLTLGIFWVGQQTQLNHLARCDRNLAWLHLAFLAGVATMPFSTGLLAEFTAFRTALIVYWLNVLLLGIALYASWVYAERASLAKEGAPHDVGRIIKRRILIAQVLYAVGAALCALNTSWSIGFIVLIQLYFAVAPRLGRAPG